MKTNKLSWILGLMFIVGVLLIIPIVHAVAFTQQISEIEYKDSILTDVEQISPVELYNEITPDGTWHYYAIQGATDIVPEMNPVGFKILDSKLTTATTTTEVAMVADKIIPNKDISIREQSITKTYTPQTITKIIINDEAATVDKLQEIDNIKILGDMEPIGDITPTNNANTIKILAIKTPNWESGSFNPNVTACGTLNTANTIYIMNKSVDVAILDASCFVIGAVNITLDCNGYNITNSGGGTGDAIYSNYSNTTIKNCNIDGFGYQINIDGFVRYINISNINSSNSIYSTSILFDNSAFSSITNLYSNDSGIFLSTSSNVNIITNSILAGYLSISGSDQNTITNITTISGLDVYDGSHDNIINNSIIGDSYGFSILIDGSNNTFSNNVINAGGVDFGIDVQTLSGDSSGNLLINNTINNYGISGLYYRDSLAHNNIACLNEFTDSGFLYINDKGINNQYNCSYTSKNQGNVYPNVIDGTVNIIGGNTSSKVGYYLGLAGAGYPYSSTTSDGKMSCLNPCIDYAPLTLSNGTNQRTFTFISNIGGELINNRLITLNDTTNHVVYTTTNGMLTYNILSASTNVTITVNASYMSKSATYTFGTETGFAISLSPMVSILFKDEATLGNFNMTSPDSMSLEVYYTNGNLSVYNIRNWSGAFPINFTSAVSTIRVLEYYTTPSVSTIQRTYVASTAFNIDTFNFTIYLLDLRTTSVVLSTFIAFDLTSQYRNTIIGIYKTVDGVEQVIASDYIDAQNSVTTYLIDGQKYNIKVLSDNKPTRVIGAYYGAAGIITLQLFQIKLTSDAQSLGTVLSYQTYMDNSSGVPVLRSVYNSTTSGLISDVTWKIYNNSKYGALLVTSIATSDSGSFAYTIPAGTSALQKYYVTMDFNIVCGTLDPCSSTISYPVTVKVSESISIPGQFDSPWTLNWIIFLMLLVLALSLNSRTASVGSLLLAGLAAFMAMIGWFTPGPLVGGAYVVVAIAVVVALIGIFGWGNRQQ